MDSEAFQPRSIVNGAYMKRFINKPVSVFLKVQNITSGGSQILGETTDKHKINVLLNLPLNMPLNGWIEVIGTPINNGENMRCTEVSLSSSWSITLQFKIFNFIFKIINFEENEGDEKFDEEAHNMLVTFLHNCPELYKDREE